MKLRKDNLPWVFDLLTLIAVVIGLTFAGIELRQVRAAQEAQTVLQLFETLKSEDYVSRFLTAYLLTKLRNRLGLKGCGYTAS